MRIDSMPMMDKVQHTTKYIGFMLHSPAVLRDMHGEVTHRRIQRLHGCRDAGKWTVFRNIITVQETKQPVLSGGHDVYGTSKVGCRLYDGSESDQDALRDRLLCLAVAIKSSRGVEWEVPEDNLLGLWREGGQVRIGQLFL